MASDLPPQDLEAERQVLGALLVRPDLILPVSSIVKRSDFYLEQHRLIYDSLLELFHAGQGEIDGMRLIHYLQDRSILDKGGGAPYILRLQEDVMAPSNAPVHARRVSFIALRRELMDAADKIKEEARRPQQDENVFLKGVEDEILKITNRSFSRGILPIRDLKEEFSTYMEKLIQSRGAPTGTLTHFPEFDRLTSGLHAGELIVLAARPGMGKTTLALNIGSNMAIRGKKNVLVYSLEMSRLELLLRMVCSESQFDHSSLKRGNIPASRTQDVLTAMETIFRSPIAIDDSGTLDIWDCITRTRKYALELANRGETLSCVIIDYLQLMSDPGARKQGRQFEVASVSRSLKQLAKMVQAPVLALSQMNRSVEQRRGDSARPQLSDLRESGAIEQDADIVMFIHREFPNPEDPEYQNNVNKAEVILAKHRNGPTDSFKLSFRPEINRFDSLEEAQAGVNF